MGRGDIKTKKGKIFQSIIVELSKEDPNERMQATAIRMSCMATTIFEHKRVEDTRRGSWYSINNLRLLEGTDA